ncbi:MAG TPA: hypothetical protein VH062_17095 [Polyangiaceae bacterium]|nr:hypothetical protein [Polyangiaceae bacterium]
MRGPITVIASLAILCGCSESPRTDDGGFVLPPVATTGGAAGAATTLPPVGGSAGMTTAMVGGAGGSLFPATGGAGGMPLLPPATGGAPNAGGAAGAPDGAAPMPTTSSTAYVPPPGALADISFEMASVVQPGGESLMCIYAQMPTDRGVIAVPSAESTFTPGSHHLLAYRSDLTAIPAGQAGTVWNCEDGTWMVHERGSYYEAQEPMSRRDLPPGVAHRFQPGEVVIIQTHYINPNTDPLDAHAKLTLHTVDVSTVPNEAGSIIFTDANISVPPGGKARSTMTCTLPSDIYPALLWSHMHKQGINFVATTDDAAAAASLGTLYAETEWDEPHPRTYPYDPPVMLHANSHITFSCDYANPNSYTLTFGQSAETNEMCILHGMYWPRMSSSGEQCSGGTTSRGAVPTTPPVTTQ